MNMDNIVGCMHPQRFAIKRSKELSRWDFSEGINNLPEKHGFLA